MATGDTTAPLCRLADIGEAGKELRVDGAGGPQWLMLFNRDGAVSAWQNVCPHQGRALNWAPDRFLFSDEGLLVCAHHGASFELPGGRCVSGPCEGAHLKPVAIRIENDHVYLDGS